MSDISDQPDQDGRLDSRGTWWVASITVILLILAGLIAVLVWGNGGKTQRSAAAPAPTGGTTPQAMATASPSPAASCNPPASEQTVPRTAPPDVHWTVVNTVALPWSTTAGAAKRVGALWTCYAHTPTGALMAAAVLTATPASPQGAEVLSMQVVAGPNRDAQLHSLRQQPPVPKQPGETAAIAGFRFLDYSPDRATVQIAGAFGTRFLTVTMPLTWADGDWKLNLDPPGGAIPGQGIPSLAGYTQWGAQ